MIKKKISSSYAVNSQPCPPSKKFLSMRPPGLYTKIIRFHRTLLPVSKPVSDEACDRFCCSEIIKYTNWGRFDPTGNSSDYHVFVHKYFSCFFVTLSNFYYTF